MLLSFVWVRCLNANCCAKQDSLASTILGVMIDRSMKILWRVGQSLLRLKCTCFNEILHIKIYYSSYKEPHLILSWSNRFLFPHFLGVIQSLGSHFDNISIPLSAFAHGLLRQHYSMCMPRTYNDTWYSGRYCLSTRPYSVRIRGILTQKIHQTIFIAEWAKWGERALLLLCSCWRQ